MEQWNYARHLARFKREHRPSGIAIRRLEFISYSLAYVNLSEELQKALWDAAMSMDGSEVFPPELEPTVAYCEDWLASNHHHVLNFPDQMRRDFLAYYTWKTSPSVSASSTN